MIYFTIDDLAESFRRSMKSGNGFVITDKKGYNSDYTVRYENGVFSPKYGTIWGDEHSFRELYSCECGKLQGKNYEGMKCPECGKVVKFKNKNMKVTGWFILKDYYIIHPTLYPILETLIGKETLYDILCINDKDGVDKTGKYVPVVVDENSKKLDKYARIGMVRFMENFDEIIDFFYKKRKKTPEYNLIKTCRDRVFTKYYPVMTIYLRPIAQTDEDLFTDKLNRKFVMLSTKIYKLNNDFGSFEENQKIILESLQKIQGLVNFISTKIRCRLDKKPGHIRKNILGSRYDWAGRCVIVPSSGTKINEVKMPYLGFLELKRGEIINVLTKMENMSLSEAQNEWYMAKIKFSKKIYNIMKYLIKNTKGGLWLFINRNPSIQLGSLMSVKIIDVKKDINDLTLSIPINICPIMAADFDGDVENIMDIKDGELKAIYSKSYDPRKKMVVSRNDGLFNSDFNLIKDQLICLHQFCKIGRRPVRKLGIRKIK